MTQQPYHGLVVWQEAHRLVLETYRLTDAFPKHEIFGLTSQLRRAAASVPTNIVEGYAKSSKKEKVHFLDIARGSLAETAYLLELSRDLKYLTIESHEEIEGRRAKTSYLLNRFMGSFVSSKKSA